jgi:hypothetical protein
MVKLYMCLSKYAQHHEDVGGSRCIGPHSLDFGEWSASRPDCFTPGGNSSRFSLDRRQNEPQSRSGLCGEV